MADRKIDSILNLIINGLPSIPFICSRCYSASRNFKPYYKWITFNTYWKRLKWKRVLCYFKPYYKWITFNTSPFTVYTDTLGFCNFKPYYKWITFNTLVLVYFSICFSIFDFKPYYKWITFNTALFRCIQRIYIWNFKPYYKWITFNTYLYHQLELLILQVLNLIINGLPSILNSYIL